MSNKIALKYEGKLYTLEYNCSSIKWMERNGFSESDDDFKVITTQDVLFAGAFLMHHRNIVNDDQFRSEMWKAIPNKVSLNQKLSEMAVSVIKDLMAEPEEGAEGNATWEEV